MVHLLHPSVSSPAPPAPPPARRLRAAARPARSPAARFASASTRSTYCARGSSARAADGGTPRRTRRRSFLDGEDEQPAGRSASAAAATTSSSAPKYTSVSADTITSNASGCVAQVGGQLDLDQLVVDVLLLGLASMPRRQIDARPAGARTARSSGPHKPGAAAGVEHVEALRRLDARVRQHRRHQRRGAVRAASRASTRSSRRSCRRSSRRTRPTPAPARRGRSTPPACAARSDRPAPPRATLRRSSTALSTSPSVQCASASSRRASGCFGLSVITLQKQTTASCVRFWPFSRMPRLVYASMCSGFSANGGAIGRFRFGRLALSPAAARRDCCARWRASDRARSRAGTRRSPRPAAADRLQDDAEIAVPVGPVGLELEAPLDQRDGLVAPPLLVGEHAGDSAARRDSRARPRGSGDRPRPPRPTARSAAAGWRSTSPPPG